MLHMVALDHMHYLRSGLVFSGGMKHFQESLEELKQQGNLKRN